MSQNKLCYEQIQKIEPATSEDLRGDLLNIYVETPAHLHPRLPQPHVTLTPFWVGLGLKNQGKKRPFYGHRVNSEQPWGQPDFLFIS